MEIAVEQVESRVPVTVFHLNGDLMSENPLESKAREAVEAGARYVLLDLSNVPFVSSTGLRALHHIYMLLRGHEEDLEGERQQGVAAGTYTSKHLKLLKPSKNAMRTLSLAGYDMFLDIFQKYDEAIASFGG